MSVVELPNRLFSGGRSVLAQFGYKHLADGESREDWAEMWELLRGDFPPPSAPSPVKSPAMSLAPAYEALSPQAQAAARLYMSCRLRADHFLEQCEQGHVALFSGGINGKRVEAYSLARDCYEQSVEEFGQARQSLEQLLCGEQG